MGNFINVIRKHTIENLIMMAIMTVRKKPNNPDDMFVCTHQLIRQGIEIDGKQMLGGQWDMAERKLEKGR